MKSTGKKRLLRPDLILGEKSSYDFSTKNPYDPDKELWISIILQAVFDACNCHGKVGEKAYWGNEARQWFDRAGLDFRTACDMASQDYTTARKHALFLINSGRRFRTIKQLARVYAELISKAMEEA